MLASHPEGAVRTLRVVVLDQAAATGIAGRPAASKLRAPSSHAMLLSGSSDCTLRTWQLVIVG